ncbi:MAG: hypothetical protein ACFE8L_06500 [Candidatus Hodarchaeota archaeon]
MDSGVDFITPEFLNILFFQQKNVVIFPYVDLKHLHSLELFTVGYNIVDLESTALHNLKEILEYEKDNSYSQNPTLFFIYNVSIEQISELMELEGIRCIVNTKNNAQDLADGSEFLFYNKKNNQFLNYDMNLDLDFENYLIKNSENEIILQDKIMKIKTVATRIFTELMQDDQLFNLPEILADYKKEYWKKILMFTQNYYDVKIPDIESLKFKNKLRTRVQKQLKDYSYEYEIIISQNKSIAKEFIQLLHEFRSRRVNPANLELEQLFNPQKLYTYLRNHHWKDGVDRGFIEEWVQMNISRYTLTENDLNDYQVIFQKLNLPIEILINLYGVKNDSNVKQSRVKVQETSQIPSIKDFPKFKKWLLEKVRDIEKLLN